MGCTPAGQTREKVLRHVRKRLLGGSPPTVRDVEQAFGFKAVQTAREHLEALVAQGHLGDGRGGRQREGGPARAGDGGDLAHTRGSVHEGGWMH